MQISQTRELAVLMAYYTNQMADSVSSIRSQSYRISSAWQGGDAKRYTEHLRRQIRCLEDTIEDLEYLTRILNTEIEERIQIDQLGVQNLQSLPKQGGELGASSFLGLGIGFGNISFEGFSWLDGNIRWDQMGFSMAGIGGMSLHLWGKPLEPFNWFSGIKEIIKDGSDDLLKSFTGNGWAWISPILEKNDLASIKTLEKVDGFLESDMADNLFGIGANTLNGLIDGENFQKAAFSGILSYGLQAGVKYLVPGVGTVMLVSSLIQLGGHISSSVMNAVGLSEQAAVMNNVLETIDLGGYVDDFSDSITDWVLNPSEAPDFSDMADRATRFSCGMDIGVSFEAGQSISINAYPM